MIKKKRLKIRKTSSPKRFNFVKNYSEICTFLAKLWQEGHKLESFRRKKDFLNRMAKKCPICLKLRVISAEKDHLRHRSNYARFYFSLKKNLQVCITKDLNIQKIF